MCVSPDGLCHVRQRRGGERKEAGVMQTGPNLYQEEERLLSPRSSLHITLTDYNCEHLPSQAAEQPEQ